MTKTRKTQTERPIRLYCAIDTGDLDGAMATVQCLGDAVDGLKLGLEFFAGQGPVGVRRIAEAGLPIFLDLKLHDIPNTVAGAVRAVAPLNPALLTVHTAGGAEMMRRAADEARTQADRLGLPAPELLGVTVMTSLDEADMRATGIAADALSQVRRLTALALDSGLDGVVCSAFEIGMIRREFGDEPLLVVPGIRPSGAEQGDQKRVMTPARAAVAGADVLVVGRPITQADEPAGAARAMKAEIADGC